MLSWSFNPVPKNGLGCFPFARRYSGNHFCFLFLRVLRCFSSPSSSRDTYVFGIRCHPSSMTGSPIRISADLCFLTDPRSVSPFGASFFSPRSPRSHRPPFSLYSIRFAFTLLPVFSFPTTFVIDLLSVFLVFSFQRSFLFSEILRSLKTEQETFLLLSP